MADIASFKPYDAPPVSWAPPNQDPMSALTMVPTIPEEPAVFPDRQHPVGTWVPPSQRAHREWHSILCRCGQKVIFPWMNMDYVSCPKCGSHNVTRDAVVDERPSATIQMQAIEDEKRFGYAQRLAMRSEARGKKLASHFQWLKRAGDAMERIVLGKPYRYGRYKMYLQGRLLLSPSSAYCLIPFLIIGGPYLVVMIYFNQPDPWRSVMNFFVAAALFSMTIAHLTEPGIVAKQPASPEKPSIVEEINGYLVERKWCTTCNIHRPYRASHCAECDVCVDYFDHHCHITGTCVGKRNFRPFVAFVLCITIADGLALVACTMHLFYYSHRLGYSGQAVTVALIGFIWTLVCFNALALMCYSLYMVCTSGLTTRELIKGQYARFSHPWFRSKWHSCYAMLLEARPASQIHGKTEADLDHAGAV